MQLFEKSASRRTMGAALFLVVFVLSYGISLAVPVFVPGDIVVTPRDKILSEAVRLINAEKYDAAIDKVREVLSNDPDSAPAHEILGVALIMKEEIDKGLVALKKAVQLDPNQSSALTKIGYVHMARKQYKKAKQAFIRAIKITPNDCTAHRRLGVIYEGEGKYNQALEHYEKGIMGMPPGYVGVKVNLARLYNRSKRFDKTIDLLGGLITGKSKDTTAHILLGTAYLGLRKIDEAIREFKIARDLEPQTEEAHLSLGIAYRKKGDLRGSLEELEEVVKIRPKWSTGHYQIGETLFAMEEYDRALKRYRKAEKLSPNPAFVRKRIGDVYMAQKRFPQAISVYKDILESPQADPKIFDLLGTAYERGGQVELAQKTFEEMCQKYPESSFAFYRLGLFYGFVKKNYDEAIHQFKTALSISPENANILRALSIAYNQKGDKTNAIETAREIVKVRPNSTADTFYLATLCQGADRKKEAIKLYRAIISQRPEHVMALNNLAVILSETGDKDEALKLAKKAVSVAPESGTILDTFGWILFKQGKNRKALKVLKKSASLLPNNPTGLYHLGAVYHAMGNRKAAKRYLEGSLELSKEFEGADEAKRLLNEWS